MRLLLSHYLNHFRYRDYRSAPTTLDSVHGSYIFLSSFLSVSMNGKEEGGGLDFDLVPGPPDADPETVPEFYTRALRYPVRSSDCERLHL